MQSRTGIKSTALELDVSMRSDGFVRSAGQILVRYSLVVVTLVLILFFSFATEHFASVLTLRAMLGDKSIVALLALAASITMITGKIDLNVGFAMTLWHVLPISMQVYAGMSWQAAVLIVLGLGLIYGILNGLLVALADIDSFVATLGNDNLRHFTLAYRREADRSDRDAHGLRRALLYRYRRVPHRCLLRRRSGGDSMDHHGSSPRGAGDVRGGGQSGRRPAQRD